jgi:sulfoxide reductase heme-binding subunit YedZ
MTDSRFIKALIFTNSLVPIAMLGWDGYRGQLGANPLEYITRTTGMLTLVFLLLSLLVTPARKLTGLNWLGKHRRMIGLFAFFYASLHFITYVWFDRFFNFRSTVADIAKRPFIAVGMACFFIMVPLAITSTNKMVKRLGGKRWARLHKIVYLAGILGVLHFYMLVKSDIRLPVRFALVLTILFVARVVMVSHRPNSSTGVVPPTRKAQLM